MLHDVRHRHDRGDAQLLGQLHPEQVRLYERRPPPVRRLRRRLPLQGENAATASPTDCPVAMHPVTEKLQASMCSVAEIICVGNPEAQKPES